VSRLDYAPKLKEIEITDIKKGLGVFTPKPDKAVSFAALKAALKKAGYTLDSAEIVVSGALRHEGRSWWLVAEPTGQRFALEGAGLEKVLAGAGPGTRLEVTGDWKTEGSGAAAHEVVSPRAAKRSEGAAKSAAAARAVGSPAPGVRFMTASFSAPRPSPFTGSLVEAEPPAPAAPPPAPIRVTSPGLTVYKGGAVTPRLYLIKQHLGGLEVSRQVFQLSVSYTPSPRTQLEIEVPVSRTSFDDGANDGAGFGLGNVTLWTKYRFYRTVKTYGDRQAAVRFGLELPTGKKDAPTPAEVDAPAFVRQQLTPISGGLSPHLDVSFSQAGGRFIFGGNAEGVLRSERDGFRVGHEVRVNTDLEYVLLPFKYEQPGGELFLILETSFVHRGRGRLDGAVVEGSKSTEYYLAPGLQYAAHPRFVVEGSVQLPVVRNTGPLVLLNDRNVLLGVRYLF
jgi:hypothetical protein